MHANDESNIIPRSKTGAPNVAKPPNTQAANKNKKANEVYEYFSL